MSNCRHRIGKFSLFIFLLILGGIIISSPVSGDQFVDIPGFVYSYEPASNATSPVLPASPLIPATPPSEGSAPGGSNALGTFVFAQSFGVSDTGPTSIPGDRIIFDSGYLLPMSGAEHIFLPGINPDPEQGNPDPIDRDPEPEVPPEILDLIEAIKSGDSDTRVAASKALIAIGSPAIDPLIPYLGAGEYYVRLLVADTLGEIGWVPRNEYEEMLFWTSQYPALRHPRLNLSELHADPEDC